MAFSVSLLSTKDDLNSSYAFPIDRFQWTCAIHPQTTVRIGFLPNVGLLLRFDCIESDPKRTFTTPQSPVCLDSAVEFFLTLAPQLNAETGVPSNDCLYLNFEMNANGALHAKYGKGRKNRITINEQTYRDCNCHVDVQSDLWIAYLCVPLPLLNELYGIDNLKKGDSFYCNFYKISESPEIEHYVSFSPVFNKTPNFHLPCCFEKAVIGGEIPTLRG